MLDWIFEHFGPIGLFIVTYKFSVLAIVIVAVLVWLVWEALKQAYVPIDSLIDKVGGGKYQATGVPKGWVISFCLIVLVCMMFLVYGAWDYSQSSALLREFPLGYVTFRTDSVSGVVTPVAMRRGLEVYEYDFRPVRVLENDAQIKLALPDVLKGHQKLISGAQIGGDRNTMEEYGSGYFFSNGGTQVWAIGKVLSYEGNDILWVVGFQRTHLDLP